MPPGAQNPNLEPLPDFNGPGYQAIRDLIVAQVPNLTPQQAADQLQTAYDADKQTRIAAWEQLVRDGEEAEALQAQQLREEEEARRAEEEKLAEAETKELEKKKPKINDFDEDRMADSVIMPRPSPFALNKLKNFEYVELSYFTPEGCAIAAEENRTAADEAFGLTNLDGFMALKPVASFRASKHVVKDKDLSWRQMTMGKSLMLHHMNKLGWPEKHVNALAHFYFMLEDHPMRMRSDGDKILIIFQAAVRREWHDALDRNEGFNISKINPDTLRTIADEHHDNKRAEGLSEVSFPYLITMKHLTKGFRPFLPSFLYDNISIHAKCQMPNAKCHMPHTLYPADAESCLHLCLPRKPRYHARTFW
jgi:hypothetical protein